MIKVKLIGPQQTLSVPLTTGRQSSREKLVIPNLFIIITTNANFLTLTQNRKTLNPRSRKRKKTKVMPNLYLITSAYC